MGRHGPLPTPFAAYLRCCGTPQDPFLKRIAFLTELNTKLVSLCDALLDVQIIEKCNCINSDVKSAEIENEENSTVEEEEGSVGRILERSVACENALTSTSTCTSAAASATTTCKVMIPRPNDTTAEHVSYATGLKNIVMRKGSD